MSKFTGPNHLAVRAFVGVGSNLANPLQQVKTALQALHHLPNTCLIKSSKIYRNPSLSGNDQPDYINAVVAVDTQLGAHDLLKQLQNLEQLQGRTRSDKRWEARTLDLDLLLYGEQIISTPFLIVPHPELYKRNFVLYPLADIDPNLILPNKQHLSDLLLKCSRTGLEEV